MPPFRREILAAVQLEPVLPAGLLVVGSVEMDQRERFQILWAERPARCDEIGRAGGGDDFLLEKFVIHIGRDGRAIADSDVDAFLGDVEVTVRDDEAQVNVGILLAKAADPRHQPIGSETCRRGDHQDIGVGLAHDVGGRAHRTFQRGRDFVVVSLPDLCEGQRAAFAAKQHHPR